MRTAREDVLLLFLLNPVFRASSASGREGRRMSPLEAFIVFPDPPWKFIRCFSGFYLNGCSCAMHSKKLFSRKKRESLSYITVPRSKSFPKQANVRQLDLTKSLLEAAFRRTYQLPCRWI